MTVSTPLQPDYTTQNSAAYKAAIDGGFAALWRLGTAFAPHEQASPDMTVRLDAGVVWDGATLTEVAAQSTGTITAPASNPRIDLVVIDQVTGAVSVVTGTEDPSPTAPAPGTGKAPVAEVALATATTAITNSLITDRRVPPLPAVVGQSEAEAGTATTPRLWTAERVAQAVTALGNTDAIQTLQDQVSYLALLRAIDTGATVYGLPDGFADQFTDETGVDTSASTGQVYDAAGDYYSNLTSPTVSASDNPTSNFASASLYTFRIRIPASALSTSGTTVAVKLRAHSSDALNISAAWIGHAAGSGNAWDFDGGQVQLTFSGSNTVAIGGGTEATSDYVEFALDETQDVIVSFQTSSNTRVRQNTGATGWSSHAKASASEAGTTAPTGYSNEANTNYSVVEVLVRSGSAMVLISEAFTADAAPASARAIVLIDPQEAITLNTDVIAEISRDDGANWSGGTLVQEAALGSLVVLGTGAIDVSGQPSDTDVRIRVRTPTSKSVRVHGWSPQWG